MIIEITAARREITRLREQQDRSVALLKRAIPHLGMTDREAISEHLAEIEGTRHNPMDWDVRDRNGEQ